MSLRANLNDTEFPLVPNGFPLSFSLIEVVPMSKDSGRVLVRWELVDTTSDLSDFEFYIDRGDAPDQIPAFQHVTIDGVPWRSRYTSTTTESENTYQIGGPISALDFYEFIDFTPKLRNLHKLYYYRVRIRRISTQEEFTSSPQTWKGDLDLEGMYVVDEHNYLLEDTSGVPCLVLPRRRSGVLCTQCFDPIQKKRTASHCRTCFGTNWIGGFHKPIDVFADLSPTPDNTIIKNWGETQPTETDIFLTNYPLMHEGDLVVELRQGKLWRVMRTRPTEKRRETMLQFIRVVEVNPADVEYKFPLDKEFILKKVREFEEYKKRREF